MTHSATQEAVTTAVLLHLALRRQTRKELAQVLGVDPSGVTKRLQGVRRWSLDDLDALARWWDVTPAQLLDPPVDALAGVGVPATIGTGRKRRRTRQRIGGAVVVLPLPRRAVEQVAA